MALYNSRSVQLFTCVFVVVHFLFFLPSVSPRHVRNKTYAFSPIGVRKQAPGM